MITTRLLQKLFQAFPGSFLNNNCEFIAYPESNLYFSLGNIQTEQQVAEKILCWCSRDAYKTAPFNIAQQNEDYHHEILNNINEFLGTNFTTEEIEIIYTRLGNNVNPKLCHEFIESNYNMAVLMEANNGDFN